MKDNTGTIIFDSIVFALLVVTIIICFITLTKVAFAKQDYEYARDSCENALKELNSKVEVVQKIEELQSMNSKMSEGVCTIADQFVTATNRILRQMEYCNNTNAQVVQALQHALAQDTELDSNAQ